MFQTSYKWMFAGQFLDRDTKHTHVYENGTLFIDNMTSDDVGVYRCEVTNGYETRKQEVFLKLTSKKLNLTVILLLFCILYYLFFKLRKS